ncbi:MAG: QueT transporter family protein [Clostridiales bacterium]|nr:QueT transporter family protein [Clostridiales bacterium]
MKRISTRFITQGAVIAATYVVLTFVSNLLGLASGAVQLRISEALTVLPYFTPAAIPGLFIGCLLSNLLTGSAAWDVIIGSAATLIGAVFSRLLRKNKWLVPVPPILANALIIPFVLRFVYDAAGTVPFFMLTVGAGEIICCGVLGLPLLRLLESRGGVLFRQ